MKALRRLALPIVLLVVLLALVALAGLQRPLDYALVRALVAGDAGALALADEIRLVDVPYPASLDTRDDPTLFRARLAELLARLAAEPAELPRAVVLDVWFSKDDRGIAPLAEAIAALARARVPTFASFNPDAAGRGDFQAQLREHAPALYGNALAGYGHTRLELNRGILSYPRTLEFGSAGGTHELRALPFTVARELEWRNDFAGRSLVVPVGDERSVDARTVAFVHDGDAPSGGRFVARAGGRPEWRGKVVVVGSLAKDVHAGAPQAGPPLVAWAINDARGGHRSARAPLDSPALQAGLIAVLALVTALAIAALSRLVPALQTRPAALAVLGSAVALALLLGIGAAAFSLGTVVPVGLPLAAIAGSGALGWHYATKFVASGAAEGAGRWDVFISYSRAHGDWVSRHLVEPLTAARGPDGQPLKVFFDRTAIGIGEAFTTKYMRAIVDSRVFVPVFSADYYGKSHCRNEMDLAYKRQLDGRLAIAPLALEPGAVPEIYSVLNYVDVRARPAFIDDLLKSIGAAREEAAA